MYTKYVQFFALNVKFFVKNFEACLTRVCKEKMTSKSLTQIRQKFNGFLDRLQKLYEESLSLCRGSWKKNYGGKKTTVKWIKNYKKYARVKINYSENWLWNLCKSEKKLWLSGKKNMVKWKKKLRLSGNKTTLVKLVYWRLETLALYVN